MWDHRGAGRSNSSAASARHCREGRLELPDGKSFLIVKEDHIGSATRFRREVFAGAGHLQYAGFDNVLTMVAAIFEVGGKGHSLGVASFDAITSPTSVDGAGQRMMVRQPNVSGMRIVHQWNADDGSLGCGTWGGNITSENISVKHYMNRLGEPTDPEEADEEKLLESSTIPRRSTK